MRPPSTTSSTAVGLGVEHRRARLLVLARDGYRCHWCGGHAATADHHPVPRAAGGLSIPANLVAACQPCNSEGGALVAALMRGGHTGGALVAELERRRRPASPAKFFAPTQTRGRPPAGSLPRFFDQAAV